MRTWKTFVGASALSLMVLASPGAMAEGKKDRAREAIAAAEAKVNASGQVGAGMATPAMHADAAAALREAKEDLAAGRKDEAIAAANRASQLADTAIGRTQQQHAAATAEVRADAAAQVGAAQDAAVAAQQQAAAAQQQAAGAQAQAADANARADMAQQQAAAAQTAAATPPAPQVTAVTTETTKSTNVTPAKRHVVRRVVTTPAKATTTEQTTTTVATTPNP